jgi:hypothetical protein
VCFLGGSLLLGATTGAAGAVSVPPRTEQLTDAGRRDWRTGAELVRTCMATHNTRTGLAPEIVHFRIASDAAAVPDRGSDALPADWYIKGGPPSAPVSLDARYILRPETVESLFVAWRLTGDARYRAHGWAIFSAIETHCRVATGGYASVRNVDALPVELEDKMETFMMVRGPSPSCAARAGADGRGRARRSSTCSCSSRTTPSSRWTSMCSTPRSVLYPRLCAALTLRRRRTRCLSSRRRSRPASREAAQPGCRLPRVGKIRGRRCGARTHTCPVCHYTAGGGSCFHPLC